MTASIASKLQHSAIKGAIVAGCGAFAAVLIGGAQEEVTILGVAMPKVAAVGATLFVSSVATDFALPYITSQAWASIGSPEIRKLENTLIGPALTGVALVALDAIAAPAMAQGHSLSQTFLVGVGASVASGYLVDSMGWVNTA